MMRRKTVMKKFLLASALLLALVVSAATPGQANEPPTGLINGIHHLHWGDPLPTDGKPYTYVDGPAHDPPDPCEATGVCQIFTDCHASYVQFMRHPTHFENSQYAIKTCEKKGQWK